MEVLSLYGYVVYYIENQTMYNNNQHITKQVLNISTTGTMIDDDVFECYVDVDIDAYLNKNKFASIKKK
jgi:hypothetical protein